MSAGFHPVGFDREEDMAAHSQARNSGRDLTIVFADLNLERLKAPGPIPAQTFVFWPRQVCGAAADSRLLLHREMIDLVQRNLNASFSLLRRLAEAKSFGEIVELQAAHFSIQVAASIGQSEELAKLSIKTALQFVRGAYPAMSTDQTQG
jgi:hypothetical protein